MEIIKDSSVTRKKRVAFLTIGQSPRDDVVPGLLESITVDVDHTEFGALDGIDTATLAPGPGDLTLCTRLRDGSAVMLGKRWLTDRLQAIIQEIDGDFDLITLLCTGRFKNLHSKTLIIGAEVEIEALPQDDRCLGVVVPEAVQIGERTRMGTISAARYSYYSPYQKYSSETSLDKVAKSLCGCSIILMDCIAYSEDVRASLQSKTGRPVVLAKDILADKINLSLQQQMF